MAIFGPQDDYIAEHIKSITDMIEVPFIDTRYMINFWPYHYNFIIITLYQKDIL